MKLEHSTVTFKSSAEWYELERQGVKPCTVRLMSEDEFQELAEYDPLRICIARADDPVGNNFTRTELGIYRVGGLLGQALVLICWDS